jgi:ketosteroid isomerase-like protein
MTPSEEIIQAEKAWLQAHLDLDLNAIKHLMHPDYKIIRPDGSVWDKAQALSSYTRDERHWNEAEIDQLIIHVFDNTGLVVGRWRAKGVSGGEVFNYAARYTSLWVKVSGEWRIVSDHSTTIEEKG